MVFFKSILNKRSLFDFSNIFSELGKDEFDVAAESLLENECVSSWEEVCGVYSINCRFIIHNQVWGCSIFTRLILGVVYIGVLVLFVK